MNSFVIFQSQLFYFPVAILQAQTNCRLQAMVSPRSIAHLSRAMCRSCRLLAMSRAGIGAVPIVDAEGRVVGIYSRSDITFLATAADPGAVLEVT